jgi:hypothetical protein
MAAKQKKWMSMLLHWWPVKRGIAFLDRIHPPGFSGFHCGMYRVSSLKP